MRYDQLIDLVREHKPSRIVEIGTHHGLRAWRMCHEAIQHSERVVYTGYDLWDEATPTTNEREMNGKGPGSISKATAMLEHIKALDPNFSFVLIKGDTRATLRGSDIVADFVFIDGGHSVETIRSDYEAVKGSKVIVFDDYYVSGADISKFGCNEVIKDIPHELLPKIDSFGNDLRIQMAVISNA